MDAVCAPGTGFQQLSLLLQYTSVERFGCGAWLCRGRAGLSSLTKTLRPFSSVVVMPRAEFSPSTAQTEGGARAKEVAIAVVAVSINASCRRFRISGYPFLPNPILEDRAFQLRQT